jgi:hydroxyacylglutathione hydrolase
MLITKMFTFGVFSTNCFVVFAKDSRDALIVDPGLVSPGEVDEVTLFIKANLLKLKLIINTHGHPDHSCGNGLIKDIFHIPICIHEDDAYMFGQSGWETARYFGFDCVSPSANFLLHEGDYVKFGEEALRVIHSPGHSSGSILLVGKGEVFTGDTLFAGSIGRTDFPGSSENEMQISLRKLLSLSDSFVVYPGHGPVTTINEEKRTNPFLQRL